MRRELTAEVELFRGSLVSIVSVEKELKKSFDSNGVKRESFCAKAHRRLAVRFHYLKDMFHVKHYVLSVKPLG